MGTAGYMSPEQARESRQMRAPTLRPRGDPLRDALGPAGLRRDTPVDTLAAVLRSDPPEIEADGVPPGLERVVRRLLEKDPGERFQSAHDLGLALETLSGPAPPTLRSKRRRWRVAVVLAALGVLAAGAGAWLWSRGHERGPAGPGRIVPFTADGGWKFAPRLSPDGERVAYTWNGPGQDSWHIYIKGLGRGTRPVRLTDHLAGAWARCGRPTAGRSPSWVRWRREPRSTPCPRSGDRSAD